MNDITVITGKERRKVLAYLNERFGIDKNIFNNYVFVKRGKKIWITNSDVANKKYKDIKIESIGMLFIRLQKNGMKMTTNAAQMFGKHAKKNIIKLSKTQAYDVLQGFNLKDIQTNAEDGYVIMKYSNYVLGIGLKRGNFIMNMIPKARIIRIESI